MTQDEEMWLRELAAERCVIPQITARLGPISLWSKDGLEAEIRRAVEAEREACAKLCHNVSVKANYSDESEYHSGRWRGSQECYEAIRARREKK